MTFLAVSISLVFLLQGVFTPAASAQTLQGGVEYQAEHSTVLPPVPPPLRTGCLFRESVLPQSNSNVRWFRIPSWAAGTWQRQQVRKKILGFIPMVSKDVGSDELGYQTDAKGDIWHCVMSPSYSRTEQALTYTYFVVDHTEPVQIQENSICGRSTFSAICVDKVTNEIRSTYRGEQISTQISRGTGVSEIQYTLAEYKETGRYVRTSKGSWTSYLVSQYKPRSFSKGQDLRRSLAEYLASRGMYDRIPNRIPNVQQEARTD